MYVEIEGFCSEHELGSSPDSREDFSHFQDGTIVIGLNMWRVRGAAHEHKYLLLLRVGMDDN